MTFAYCGDVHCQRRGDQQNQIYKFSPKSDLFQFLQSIKFLLQFFSTTVLLFVSQRLNLDVTFCRKRHLRWRHNYFSNTWLYVNFREKFYTFLAKWSLRVILVENYENILKFVKVVCSMVATFFFFFYTLSITLHVLFVLSASLYSYLYVFYISSTGVVNKPTCIHYFWRIKLNIYNILLG